MIMKEEKKLLTQKFAMELKFVRRVAKNTLGIQYRDWVDDLSQDAIVKSMKNLEKYDAKIASKEAWLFTLTKNLCLDFMKKKSNNPYNYKEINSVFDLAGDMGNGILSKEDILIIRKALLKLKEQDRAILSLKFFEEYSGREIAKELQISETLIPAYVKRAKEKLKKIVMLML